ncbi:MAG TPA: SpoIID/LytB domain-containing protein [Solirubrobacterales bacterium]|nr:SpoIID/LytB domain-containing protein [Solirubrobacterales bacterium]
MPLDRRKLLPLCLCLTALAAAPSAARAAVTWIIQGHGFGHGVGMSQYGAYGYARHGRGYRFILGHYYGGTTIGTLGSSPVVRVLLEQARGDIGFSGATAACGKALSPTRDYQVHPVGSTLQLRTSGGRGLADCGGELRAGGTGSVRVTGLGVYAGSLVISPSDGGGVNVVNAVGVDQYVKGVIANESPPSWPMAELRAQAVASRSFALSGQVGGAGFDLYSDTRSQVYRGVESQTARTDLAANSTRGQVVIYRGRIAETFFSACSGGHTESVQNVFGGPPIPYLVGVPDPYDYYCPLQNWTLRFSGPAISAKLGAYLKGLLRRVLVTQHGVSPRIVWARLYGTGGVTRVSGEQLEIALGAYSTWMSFRRVG